MAKGKSAVALFEVLGKDKRFNSKASEPAQKSPVQKSSDVARQAVDLWRKRHSDPETWTTKPTKPTVSLRETLSTHIVSLKSVYNATVSRAAKIAGGVRPWIVRHSSVFYGTAGAAAVIGLLLTVRHFYNPANQPITAEDILRHSQPRPHVLDVGSDSHTAHDYASPASTAMLTASTAGPAQPLSPEMMADVQQASAKASPDSTATNLAQPGARIVNMHYVLMQSYFEEKTAIAARDFLNQNGISCTIERRVKGWRSDFYQVVGLQGFTRPSGPQYLAYRNNVVELGEKFSPKSKYKRFQPQAIKW